MGEIRRLQRGSRTVIRAVDTSGHLVKVTEPDASGKPVFVTDISYNQAGRVTKIVQHGREGEVPRVRSFAYDDQGHVISATSPEAGTVTYTYDADGNLASKKDALGRTVTYSWDEKKRLTGKTFSDGTPSSFFTYNTEAKDYSSFLEIAGERQSRRSYHYDSKGRLTSLSMQTAGEHSATYMLGFRYDDARRVTTITYPDGTEIQQAFTLAGLLKSVSQGTSVLFSKPEYLVPSGRITSVTIGDGITLKREYDRHNRVQRMTITSPISGALLDESFDYTDWGSVKRITDNLKLSGEMRFGYDELQRVKSTEGVAEEAYVYDSFGNLARKIGGAVDRGFDEHNRITGGEGISYDATGQVIDDGLHSYSYDGNGLIDSVDGGRFRYSYDAEGNRIRKRLLDGDHDYLWWNDQLLAERTPDGTWTDYVYVNGARFASLRKSGHKDSATVDVAYFLTSGLGTTRMKLSSSGTVLERETFAPFGTHVSNRSAAANISFSDEMHDEETGLDTYRFRSYNLRLRRWMSPDPSSLHFASLGNPQTYNLYSFVTNDPLRYLDVKGLCPGDGTGDDDGECYIPPYDPCEYVSCDGGDNPPPPDPCQYDACVVTKPDPPVDPDPLPPFDPTIDCTDGTCAGNPWGPYDASPTVDDSGIPYNTANQVCTTGSCTITIYYGANPFGNVCSGLRGTSGAVASVYAVWDCKGTLSDCQNNQAKFRNDCYAQHQTPLDPQYGFGGQGSGGSFYYQACCSVP